MSDIQKPKTKDRRPKTDKVQLKSRMANLLMFLPNLVRLCANLLMDGRVPMAEKALFAGAILYFLMPLDFLPDILPFLGQVDDIYLISLTLLRLINRTDDRVVRELWQGGGDIVQLADSVANVAPMLLPRRVNRVLTSRVELAPQDKIVQAVTSRDTPLVREIPQPDDERKFKVTEDDSTLPH